MSYAPQQKKYDNKTKKTFLKRTRIGGNDSNLSEQCFYIGAKINIFGRQFNITNYADVYTKSKLENRREKTFCLIKPDGTEYIAEIIKRFEIEEFFICNCEMLHLCTDYALKFCSTTTNDNNSGGNNSMLSYELKHLTSSGCIGFELISNNGVNKLLEMAGPDDSTVAKELNPNSLRGKFGENDVRNVLYCSKTSYDANNVRCYASSVSSLFY